MGLFSGRKPHSGLVAKERLSNLLMAERLNCSPASLQMLKNDLSAAAGKYLTVEADEISVNLFSSVTTRSHSRYTVKIQKGYRILTCLNFTD